MNKHFRDVRYYLKQAGVHAKHGVQEELSPIVERVRKLIGREKEPEPEETRAKMLVTKAKFASQRAKKQAVRSRDRVSRLLREHKPSNPIRFA